MYISIYFWSLTLSQFTQQCTSSNRNFDSAIRDGLLQRLKGDQQLILEGMGGFTPGLSEIVVVGTGDINLLLSPETLTVCGIRLALGQYIIPQLMGETLSEAFFRWYGKGHS